MSKKKVKAWAVLDVDGGIGNPSVSIFDSKEDADRDAMELNKIPPPTDRDYPFGGKNIVVPCEISYIIPANIKLLITGNSYKKVKIRTINKTKIKLQEPTIMVERLGGLPEDDPESIGIEKPRTPKEFAAFYIKKDRLTVMEHIKRNLVKEIESGMESFFVFIREIDDSIIYCGSCSGLCWYKHIEIAIPKSLYNRTREKIDESIGNSNENAQILLHLLPKLFTIEPQKKRK